MRFRILASQCAVQMIIKLVLWYVKNLILNTKVKQVSQH